MAIVLTKMSVLRDAIGVEDLASMIYDMDVKSNHTDVIVSLRQYLVNMKSSVYKLNKVSCTYFCIIRNLDVSIDEEFEKVVLSKARTNRVVLDVIHDIPHLVRSSRSSAEFRMKLIELYGRSNFLCGVACTYMNIACTDLLTPFGEQ
jgi:hypothetical protein